MKPIVFAVGYVNTALKTESNSREQQLQSIHVYAQLSKVHILKIFEDESEAPTELRPGYTAMMKYIKNHVAPIDLVLVHHYENLSRSGDVFLDLVIELNRACVLFQHTNLNTYELRNNTQDLYRLTQFN